LPVKRELILLSELIKMLNDIRYGIKSEDTIGLLRSLSREIKFNDGIQPTAIFPYRTRVQRANDQQIGQLVGRLCLFEALDTSGKDANGIVISDDEADRILDKLAPKSLMLRVRGPIAPTSNTY
jgi:hypothetical protein